MRADRPRPLVVKGMYGLGDNIMQRPFIRAAVEREGEIFLFTPWPELYSDMPGVKPVRTVTRLRTQMKNERRVPAHLWRAAPSRCRIARISYGSEALAAGSISQAMESTMPLGDTPYRLDLPRLRAAKIDTGGKPLAIIRPVTERREWLNKSRNPLPQYVNEIAAMLSATHHVIALADLAAGEEWLVGDMPVVDQAFVRGEISTTQALGLVARADIVVGGVGWIVPAALAYGTKAFIVLGGNGGHNAPEVIVDPRADSSRLGFATPDNFCRCADKGHACRKTITGLGEIFATWAAQQGIPLCSTPSSAPSPRTVSNGSSRSASASMTSTRCSRLKA